MTRTIEKDKWSLRRHTTDFHKLCIVANAIKNYTNSSITDHDKAQLQIQLQEQNLYSARNPLMPLDSIDHKIRDLAFYMFGYRDKINNEKKFLFSPLGNLFLKNLDDTKKLAKIFFTMLWGMQYEHPESSTTSTFQLYPFRLIFKLLNESKLEKKLFSNEIAYVLMLTESISEPNEYENVIDKILLMRLMSNQQIAELFEKDAHTLVNAIYEWDYYSSNILESAGILIKTHGEQICTLYHPTKNPETKPTPRHVYKNKIELSTELEELYVSLNNKYPFNAMPLKLDDSERLKLDTVKEIYSFFPKTLLEHLGETSEKIEAIEELLELPKLIEQYSNNNDGEEAYLFEDILSDGFNMFYNVVATKIGGAGNTDLECLYLNEPIRKKFAVDAKSTKNKLSGINSGRLSGHRHKIGGEYTIVVTSRYVPAVKHDIKNTETVILLASTFSEYLYNCINNNVREIDFAPFDEIITDNLGKDISREISQLTFQQFATNG